MAAAKDGELHHFGAKQAFLEASDDEEMYINIAHENQKFPGAVIAVVVVYLTLTDPLRIQPQWRCETRSTG